MLNTEIPSGSSFSEGRYTIEYEARDLAGNTATCSFFVVVVVERSKSYF